MERHAHLQPGFLLAARHAELTPLNGRAHHILETDAGPDEIRALRVHLAELAVAQDQSDDDDAKSRNRSSLSRRRSSVRSRSSSRPRARRMPRNRKKTRTLPLSMMPAN